MKVDPSILRDELAVAERELVCADMIDNFARREARMREATLRVEALKRRLDEAERQG